MQTEKATFNGAVKKSVDTKVPYASLWEEEGGIRHTFDKAKIARLAENIDAVGLLQPIVVVPDKKGSKEFRIVAGRRRYRAVGLLKWKDVDVRIVDDAVGHKLSRAREVAENTNREDVPPYELAIEAHRMVMGASDGEGGRLEPEFTREEAALFFGCSAKYLNNLVRAVEKCSPVVLAAWKKDPENISANMVSAWAVLDHADQESALEEYVGGTKADKKRIKKKASGAKAAGKKDVAAMAEKWAEKKGVFADGVRAALAYVLGERASIKAP